MFVSGGDIDNCFYRIGLPEGLQDFFPLSDIAAGYLGINSCEGLPVSASDSVTPVLTVLPMGGSWAMHLVQTVLVHSLVLSGFTQPSMVLDGEPGRVLSDERSCAVAGYVNNFFVFSRSRDKAQAGRDAIAKQLCARGLVVHELTNASQDAEFLGVELARGRRLSIRRRSIWKLRRALDIVLRRRSASGKLMEIPLGHLTWAGLIRRECLSFFSEVYAFQKSAGSEVVRLWPGVARELTWIRGVLPLLAADLSATWSPQVLASDASDFGVGVCARMLRPDLVATVGRCSEKWRFKVEGHTRARDSALSPGREFLKVPEVNHFGDGSDDPGCILQWARAFNEVPQDLFCEGPWSAVLAMHVSGKANILCLEGGALLLAAKHVVRNLDNFGTRCLLFVDNLPLALATAKGRANAVHLRRVLRKLSCLS